MLKKIGEIVVDLPFPLADIDLPFPLADIASDRAERSILLDTARTAARPQH